MILLSGVLQKFLRSCMMSLLQRLMMLLWLCLTRNFGKDWWKFTKCISTSLNKSQEIGFWMAPGRYVGHKDLASVIHVMRHLEIIIKYFTINVFPKIPSAETILFLRQIKWYNLRVKIGFVTFFTYIC